MKFFEQKYLKKAILILFACIILCIAMCSCTDKVINSPEDEVKLYGWSYEGEYGVSASLTFQEENAALKIKNNNDESCTISGLCVFNENNFIIIDEDIKRSFAFEYTLYGDRITLKYGDSTIDLTKEITE